MAWRGVMYRKKKDVSIPSSVSISSVDASMASNTSPEVNKAESKKLVQPRLSNFLANAKVHVSSAAPLKCATDENDENIPLATSPSLTTHVEVPPSNQPLKESLTAAPSSSTSKVPSISNFLKTPAVPCKLLNGARCAERVSL